MLAPGLAEIFPVLVVARKSRRVPLTLREPIGNGWQVSLPTRWRAGLRLPGPDRFMSGVPGPIGARLLVWDVPVVVWALVSWVSVVPVGGVCRVR